MNAQKLVSVQNRELYDRVKMLLMGYDSQSVMVIIARCRIKLDPISIRGAVVVKSSAQPAAEMMFNSVTMFVRRFRRRRTV